jgi:PleD family two-component response regulator
VRWHISTKFGGSLDRDNMAKTKILIVEDEAITARNLQNMLTDLGYDDRIVRRRSY